MKETYAAHNASVTVNAPLHQVYALFSHFNDFPKFMSFIKEVTYYDDQTSHWVAEVAGRHEWDAVNDQWIPSSDWMAFNQRIRQLWEGDIRACGPKPDQG